MRKTSGNRFTRHLAPLVFGCAACLCAVLSPAAIAEVNFTGYAKSFAVAQDSIDNPFIDEPTIWQSQNSLRLMLEGFGERTVWQLHYELSPVHHSRGLNIDLPTFNVVGDAYRLTDIQRDLLDDDKGKSHIYQNLDRFNVQFQFDAGDLTIGRQAIAFGLARIINPTDVFLPFDVQTFNTEYRTGVDAVRFQKPVGELGEIDVGIILGEDARRENSAAFLQLRGNVDGKDLHFALMEYAEQTLVGTGVATALGDFGFWFEIASVTGDEDYIRGSTGIDYAFTETTFAQVEYHYNGAGGESADEYLALAGTVPYTRGGVFLLGEEYLIPSVGVQVSPLWNLSLQAVYNLTDDSAFIAVGAEYNVADNFYMDFGYYHFKGDDLGLQNGFPDIGSEYGASPDTFYASIRFYF